MRTEKDVQADLAREAEGLFALRKRLKGHVSELQRMPGQRQWWQAFRAWDRGARRTGAPEPELTLAASMIGGIDEVVQDIDYLVEILQQEATDESTPLMLLQAKGGAR